MDLGQLLSLLVLMPVLAAVGVTTLAAFALMTALGLLTDMSFKRIFFVSFFMGLAAPVMLGAAIFSSVEDGTFERDLRDGIEQFTAGSEEGGRDFGGTLGQLQEIGREVERGDITEDQAEERIRELFVGSREGSDGEPLQITQDVQEDEGITINIDGAELSADGDEVRIQID